MLIEHMFGCQGASRKEFRGAALALAGALLLPGAAAMQLPLAPVADLPLPGNATRFDYQSLDPHKHLLFIAHLGDGEVVVVDTRTRRVLATIPAVSAVHGVLAVPALNAVYASATGTNEIVVIDESSFKITARVAGGVYPDGIAYDPVTRRIFVSDERGRTETVIDTASNRRIATIDLGGEAGNSQYDPVSHRIFVNVQTRGELDEIDPAKNALVRRTSLNGAVCVGNHGLLVDARMRRAFVACEASATLLLVNLRTMRIEETWTVGENPDVLALDPGRRRLFVAAESGVLSIFSDAAKVSPIARAYLASGAHSVAVDPLTHLLYFPLENAGGKPVLRVMAQRR